MDFRLLLSLFFLAWLITESWAESQSQDASSRFVFLVLLLLLPTFVDHVELAGFLLDLEVTGIASGYAQEVRLISELLIEAYLDSEQCITLGQNIHFSNNIKSVSHSPIHNLRVSKSLNQGNLSNDRFWGSKTVKCSARQLTPLFCSHN